MLGRARGGQASAKSRESNGKSRFVAALGIALAASFFGLSQAQAQSCVPLLLPSAHGGPFDYRAIIASGLAASAAISASITAADVAFLSQSTAFVGAPPNPQPGQEGAGAWVRGVGGNLDLKSNSTVSATGTAPGFLGGTQSGSTTCFTKYKETYGGLQVGQDIATLNIAGGWNIHFGTTAGAIGAHGEIVGGSPVGGIPPPVTQTPFDTTSQSPFVGTYVAATKENFFFDALLRYNVYDTILQSPGANFFSQKSSAHGFTFSSSVGYNYHAPSSNWFVEPSAGIIWSRTTVGALNVNTPQAGPTVQGFSGTVQINDISSVIGRLGLRVGTTFEANGIAWQPFAAVSVWHDFAGETTSSFAACPGGCFNFEGAGSFIASTANTNFGTFEQYSLGLSGQIINTGWVGFARVDYRSGPNLDGLSGVAGIRYQFTPEGVARAPIVVKAMPTKAPPLAPASIAWTGWYIGAYAGAGYGQSDLTDPGFASAGMHPGGILAGGTLGYNYQIDKYVVGLEGDGGWTNVTGSAACSPLITGGAAQPFFQTTCHDDLSWIATLAGRLGYLWSPRTLVYIKPGIAWEGGTWSVSCNLGPTNGTFFPLQTCLNPLQALPSNTTPSNVLNFSSASDVRVGGMIGFGTEFALSRDWSVKGEWDWIGFGSKTLTMSDGTVFSAKQTISEVKVGLNYHFN